ncbi:MAG: diphthine--ammonia ligase [Desulfurococcaceae archaeon]
MKATVLFTGGKDSVYALHKAVEKGFKIATLTTVIPLYKYSMLYHQPVFHVLSAQSQSLSLPLETIGVSDPSNEAKALETILKRVKEKYDVEIVVTGAVISNYQRQVFTEIAKRVGLNTYNPLWGLNQEEYVRSLLRDGIKFTLISITSMGIPHALLGKEIDENDVELLIKLSRKYGFNVSLDGGEAESLVLDAPLFKYRISIDGERIYLSEFEAYYKIHRCFHVKKKANNIVLTRM